MRILVFPLTKETFFLFFFAAALFLDALFLPSLLLEEFDPGLGDRLPLLLYRLVALQLEPEGSDSFVGLDPCTQRTDSMLETVFF